MDKAAENKDKIVEGVKTVRNVGCTHRRAGVAQGHTFQTALPALTHCPLLPLQAGSKAGLGQDKVDTAAKTVDQVGAGQPRSADRCWAAPAVRLHPAQARWAAGVSGGTGWARRG